MSTQTGCPEDATEGSSYSFEELVLSWNTNPHNPTRTEKRGKLHHLRNTTSNKQQRPTLTQMSSDLQIPGGHGSCLRWENGYAFGLTFVIRCLTLPTLTKNDLAAPGRGGIPPHCGDSLQRRVIRVVQVTRVDVGGGEEMVCSAAGLRQSKAGPRRLICSFCSSSACQSGAYRSQKQQQWQQRRRSLSLLKLRVDINAARYRAEKKRGRRGAVFLLSTACASWVGQ